MQPSYCSKNMHNINHNSNHKVNTAIHIQNNNCVITILNFIITKYQKLHNYHIIKFITYCILKQLKQFQW